MTAVTTVSVVTPSLNQGRFIRAAIDSVLAQDYPDIEYLVVDAGSTDGTLETLASYGDRIQWISEPDRGQADGVDKGIRRLSGDVIGWLNADDVYLPDAVSTAVSVLREHPNSAGVYGQAQYIDVDGAVIGPCDQVEPFDADRLVNVLDFIVQPATFFTRVAYTASGGLDRTLDYCLDYDLWIRMAKAAPFQFVPSILAGVRIYPETKTASGGLPRLHEIEAMIRRHGRRTLPTGFHLEMVVATRLAIASALRAGRWADALRLVPALATYGGRMALRSVAAAIRRR